MKDKIYLTTTQLNTCGEKMTNLIMRDIFISDFLSEFVIYLFIKVIRVLHSLKIVKEFHPVHSVFLNKVYELCHVL